MPMTEEERRRCCILGGCGCPSGGAEQLNALAELIEKAGGPHKAAAQILDLFGTGPHAERLETLNQEG
jgi:hypothetical protein